MRVLIFDDDEAIGRLVARIATMSGMEATAVTDAVAFGEHLTGDLPQVIVLDLQLSGTDGVEQMRLLADRQYTGTLVLMSGYDTRVLGTARMVGRNLGLRVERVIEKPLRVAELQQVFELLQSAEQSLSGERFLEAIEKSELVLHFQPVVTRNPKALIKLEALVRWEHPVLGLIPPEDFLPIVESKVAIVDALTDWVVGSTVESYQVLAQIGIKVPLAVNISTRNLHDLTLPDRLEQRLRAGGMPMQHLCLEITESAAFKDVGRTMDILSRMRLKGVQISIDDFGTGYSSLRLLRQMPFSEIKIDQSFVADMTTSRDSRAIVKSIIDLATNMEMGCIAEGVETAETADLLEQLGVRNLQGYLIARPMPVEAIPAWATIGMWCDLETPHSQVTSPDQGQAEKFDRGDVFHARSLSSSPKAGGAAVLLSRRQVEVMQLLSEGCAVKEIARHLNLGIGTVKVHLSLAYSALGAHNRTDAIRRAGPTLIVR
jgi:EAL domain-containing protein (putative c-di-GMP-specific phosphodiesterase class I)/DNA-binding CsgD family transcriptional regulator/ActR/RegA family two-component response regulator